MTGYVGSIDTETLKNAYFRQVLFTGKHAELVVMCLQPGEEIGKEMHPEVDQFFRIEQGKARFVLGDAEDHLVEEGDAVVVPAETYHNVLNASQTAPLRMYTLYSPSNHPEGTVHRTKADAEAADVQPAWGTQRTDQCVRRTGLGSARRSDPPDGTHEQTLVETGVGKNGHGARRPTWSLGRIAHRPAGPGIRCATASR